jgi:hypothetical protein
MRARNALAVAAMAIVAAAGCGKQKNDAIPAGPPVAFAGSYVQSCRNIMALDGGFISAECADPKGQFDLSYIKAAACKGDIGNHNGVLTCNGAVASMTPPAPAPASDTASDAASDTAASGDAASSAPPSKP